MMNSFSINRERTGVRDVTRPQPHKAKATTHEVEAEATTHEAEATTHEAEAKATTHEAEAI